MEGKQGVVVGWTDEPNQRERNIVISLELPSMVEKANFDIPERFVKLLTDDPERLSQQAPIERQLARERRIALLKLGLVLGVCVIVPVALLPAPYETIVAGGVAKKVGMVKWDDDEMSTLPR